MAKCWSQPEGRSHSQQSTVRWWSTYKWGWETTSVCFPSYLQSAPLLRSWLTAYYNPLSYIRLYPHIYTMHCFVWVTKFSYITFPKSIFPYQSHIRLSSRARQATGLPGRGSGEPKSERRLSALLDGELGRLLFTTGEAWGWGYNNNYGLWYL